MKIKCPGCGTGLHVPLPFGNLLLQEEEGAGELTKVYRSVDMTLDRQVVVKVLHPRYMNEEGVAEAFVREARSASSVSHPSIIPIYSCGEMEGKPYVVMQYMEGGSLRDLIMTKDNRVPIETICKWFLEVVEGLDAAASHGILHHDITPSNLFLDGDGNAKVGDFGLAHIVMGDASFASESGDLRREVSVARARFLSPERILTGKEGVQGDMFSLGVSMYEFLADRPPFDGDSPEAVIRSRFEQLPQPVREIRGDVPEALDALIAQCLAVNPADRPKTYSDLKAIFNGVISPEKAAKGGKPGARPASSRKPKSKPKTKTKPKRKITFNSGNTHPPEVFEGEEFESPPQPVYVASPVAWGPRIFLFVIIVIVVALVYGHISQAPWYVQNIMPLFDPTGGIE